MKPLESNKLSPSTALPWQDTLWLELCSLIQSQRLPHALLLHGPQGLGKQHLALRLAALLLCRTPVGEGGNLSPCGNCPGCHLLAAGTHPDLHLLAPESSKVIRIEQVREAIDILGKSAQQGGYRVIVLVPAEVLNRNAANALLKVLEEPGERTLLILVAHQPGRLLPTLRSRCRALHCRPPSPAQALAWLELQQPGGVAPHTVLTLANGAPLKALALAVEEGWRPRQQLGHIMRQLLEPGYTVSHAAQQCADMNIEEIVESLQLMLTELLRCHQAGADTGRLKDHGLQDLPKTLTRVPSRALHHYYRQLLQIRFQLGLGTNLNPTLVMEHLFFAWQDIGRGAES